MEYSGVGDHDHVEADLDSKMRRFWKSLHVHKAPLISFSSKKTRVSIPTGALTPDPSDGSPEISSMGHLASHHGILPWNPILESCPGILLGELNVGPTKLLKIVTKTLVISA